MKIALQIAIVALAFSFARNVQAEEQGPPPVYCPSSLVTCNPFELAYAYSKTLGTCPPSHVNVRFECGVPLPPINVECMPGAYQLLICQFDPEGVNVNLTHTWQIDSHNASITDWGRVRCNAGELVAVSIVVSNGYSSGTGYTYAVCPAYAY